MLRLVHPSPKGKVSARPTRHHAAALTPTHEERQRIYAAARNLARAYGGYDVLATVVGVPVGTLYHVRRDASYAMAVVIARAARVPVEQLLSGQPHVAGSCALCGRKGAR
jgi:hypothetical protein